MSTVSCTWLKEEYGFVEISSCGTWWARMARHEGLAAVCTVTSRQQMRVVNGTMAEPQGLAAVCMVTSRQLTQAINGTMAEPPACPAAERGGQDGHVWRGSPVTSHQLMTGAAVARWRAIQTPAAKTQPRVPASQWVSGRRSLSYAGAPVAAMGDHWTATVRPEPNITHAFPRLSVKPLDHVRQIGINHICQVQFYCASCQCCLRTFLQNVTHYLRQFLPNKCETLGWV